MGFGLLPNVQTKHGHSTQNKLYKLRILKSHLYIQSPMLRHLLRLQKTTYFDIQYHNQVQTFEACQKLFYSLTNAILIFFNLS